MGLRQLKCHIASIFSNVFFLVFLKTNIVILIRQIGKRTWSYSWRWRILTAFPQVKMEVFFIRGKNVNNLRGSMIDLIIAEKRNPASWYFGGQFKEVTDRYWVTSPCVLLCRKICIRSLQVAALFLSVVTTSHLPSGKEMLKKKPLSMSCFLKTKAKDRWLRRSAKEKLSYRARRNVLACVLLRYVT